MKTILVCISCGHHNPSPAKQCARCDAPLTNTDTMDATDIWSDVMYRKKLQQMLSPPEGSIALYIAGRDHPVLIKVDDAATLGRHVPDFPPPTVDLSQYHAGAMGVSRLHVNISMGEEGFYIEDLNSTNGTWVNGEKIKAHQKHLLNNGDQIRMGQFMFYISFATQPIS